MVFNFNTQKEIGQKFEKYLSEYAKDELELTDGRSSDFKTKIPIFNKSLTVEVKNDESKTAKKYFEEGREPNFFMERYSNHAKQSPGGCYQSKEKKIDIFLYYYGFKNLGYVFNTIELVNSLEELPNKKGHIVRNNGYDTYGFIVPHDDIKHIAKKIDFSIPNQKLIPIFQELLSKNNINKL